MHVRGKAILKRFLILNPSKHHSPSYLEHRWYKNKENKSIRPFDYWAGPVAEHRATEMNLPESPASVPLCLTGHLARLGWEGEARCRESNTLSEIHSNISLASYFTKTLLAVGSMTSSWPITYHNGIAYAPSPLITDFIWKNLQGCVRGLHWIIQPVFCRGIEFTSFCSQIE